MGYFSCYPNKSFVEGEFEEIENECRNINLPELSLSIQTEKGQVLIAGCSHTGIDKILKETLKVVKDKIELVYGGFHMIPFNRKQTEQLAAKLKNDLNVHRVAPAHCTGHLAFRLLQDTFKQNYLYAGLGETISF
jgi:7,8-dihydropterin-6-yl-methyl-4-(beta-D-ribofuranosyl)aminobenzene 5'-phosphate synthase